MHLAPAAASGLTQAEANARLRSAGPNTIDAQETWSPLRLLWRQVSSPLVLILVFASALSLVLREWIDASIIVAIVTGSVLLGFLQEYRAGRALLALRERLALTVRVLRDGSERTIAASLVVPGDCVLLAAGNLVPADGVVLEARDFLLSEASLTGESFPVERHAGDRVFLGTSVRSGTARVLVEATGRDTAYGRTAASVGTGEGETTFERGVRQFGYLLLRVMLAVVLFVLFVNVLLDRPTVEVLLFAVALAVGMSPELLPAIMAVTLSRGARQMADSGVLVRRLDALEDFGAMDVLCTDKTGTLTEGTVSLHAALDAQERPSDTVLRLAVLNAEYETGIDNPLDAAVLAAGAAAGIARATVAKIDEIPYDFVRRRITVVVESGDAPGEHLVISKGAFAQVADACALESGERAALESRCSRMCAEGFRVLGVATRRMPAQAAYSRDDEHGMRFEGFLLFRDPPRQGIEGTLSDLARLGIRIKIVTGDNRYVAAHVAGAVGIDTRSLLSGEELSRLDDDALRRIAPRTDIFAEVDPQQKERVVRALQQAGHAVGYMGDGINDAPALRAADVGISAHGAVDVARESADIVLLRRDLDVLRRGVEEGRRTFANTLKYISITTSANFGNMLSMALVTPLLPFLPLAAKQILLNNFLSDLPAMAISGDRVDAGSVSQAQRWDIGEVRRFMLVFGLVSTVFDLLTFAVLLLWLEAGQALFQTTWFLVSLLTELAVILVLRTRLPFWKSRPGTMLLAAAAAVAALALALPYTDGLAAAFGFVALPATFIGAAMLIVAAYVVTTEAAKRAFYREARGR